MIKEVYFFDTYAIFEILRGNPKYSTYRFFIPIITIFNIAELNYNLRKEFSRDLANSYTRKYWSHVIDIAPQDIESATELKIKNKDLSLPDAVGYSVAKRLNVKFLTGDETFRNMDNVEFIKK